MATCSLLTVSGDDLWRIDPANPGSEAGDYGLVGDFPIGLTVPLGITRAPNGDLFVVDAMPGMNYGVSIRLTQDLRPVITVSLETSPVG